MSGVFGESAGPTKPKGMKNEEEIKRRTALEERVQMRLEIDNKALQIVERLLDDPITEDFLLDCVKFITSQHYRDAVEERSILKQCGYPLCQTSLANIPTQKYHINRKANKVYEISERKNFCRQFCYKASKFYEAQLSDSPLWARELEGPVDVELLTEEMEGDAMATSLIAKDQVMLNERIKLEDINTAGNSKMDRPLKEEAVGLLADDLSNLTFADARRRERLKELEKISCSETTSQVKPRPIVNRMEASSEDDGKGSLEVTEGTREGTVKSGESITKQSKTEDCIPGQSALVSTSGMQVNESPSPSTSCQAGSSPKMTQGEPKRKPKKKSKMSNSQVSLLDVIAKVVMEWQTSATGDFIRGLDPTDQSSPLVPQAGRHNPLNPDAEGAPASMTSDPMTADPLAIRADPACPPVKPLPDIQCLREETKSFELKVREFYAGRHLEVKKVKKEKRASGDIYENEEIDQAIRLPLIDSKSQMAIRRRILSDRLKREYSEILIPMRMSMRDISSDLQALIHTFHLSSHNITFKPAGWTMLAFLLLEILARHNRWIADSVTNEANRGFLDMLLAKMGTSMEKLVDTVGIIERGEP